MNKFINFILTILVFPLAIFPIDDEKMKKIIWPLEMKLPISGSFAEYRNSHLHMGCDFKTYGINGFPVLSVFDARLATMSYSDYGYGLSIVLYSPSLNMYARYAHLNDLNGDVSGLEDLKHSLRLLGNPRGFSVKINPDMFHFTAGTKIARSGETGSGVSHLHLELYDHSSYYNPLKFPNYLQNDTTPPIIQSVYIDSDSGFSENYPVIKNEDGTYSFEELKDPIRINGKLRIRIAGYDIMTSRNRNNVYGVKLLDDYKVLYSKTLDQMSYREASHRDNLYDINTSSLSPTMYVYNLFNSPAGDYSLDLNGLVEGSLKVLKAELLDSSGNISSIDIPIQIGKPAPKKAVVLQKSFTSADGVLKLDFRNSKVSGEGKIEINKLDKIPEDLAFPGFTQVSDAYEVKSVNYSWKGYARGEYRGNFPDKDDGLYIYDTAFKQWVALNEKKSGKSLGFNLTRLGIIAIMKDKTPPVINFPYMVYRDFNLPEVKDPRMLERFYAVYDRGSGISNNMTVLFEGSSYPFEFDRDRNFIKLEIPLNFKKFKSYFIIQIQVQDKAGNKSEWFTDVVYL